MIEQQKLIIEQAWDNRELLNDSKTQESIRTSLKNWTKDVFVFQSLLKENG